MLTATNDLSVFDLSPSDEDMNQTRTSVKRRKLKHGVKNASTVTSTTNPAINTLSTARQALVEKAHNKAVKGIGMTETNQSASLDARASRLKSTDTSGTKLKKASANITKQKKRTSRKKSSDSAMSQRSHASEDHGLPESQDDYVLGDHLASDVQELAPRSSDGPRVQHTPKKSLSSLVGSDTPSPSPSHLAFVDLQLSSDSPSPQAMTSGQLLPRGRKRLIDRLDAPQINSSRSKSPATLAESSKSHAPARKEVALPALERSNSLQARQKYGKPRNVYGRERSHLADMVDDLDMLSGGSSQEASQQLASQLAAASQPSQLQMELELESDSADNEMIGGGRLKSIHELRQTGSINRFERDLESLLEDVDPNSKTSTTALRLQAVIKTIKKTADNDFTTFLCDRGLDRLTSWYPAVKDLISKTLTTVLLWRISHLKSISAVKLMKIANALTSSTILLSLDTMKDLIKNQKGSLSKATSRDLMEFEEEMLLQKMLPFYNGTHILLAAVALGALNRCLRQLLDLGEATIAIPKKFLTAMIVLLGEPVHGDLDGEVESRFTILCILSVLEMATGPFDIPLKVSKTENVKLAQNLASIIDACLDKHDELVQSALRFAISFCNNRPEVCNSFTSTELVQSLTKIINTRFLKLLEAAENGNEIDHDMLDSIILCLACLLNLTEHEDHLRRQVAHTQLLSSADTSLISLVSIYKSAAPVLVGTTTDGHSQVLVAFGYLSLLLCTLSLAEDVRAEIDLLLGSFTMTDVVVSGKELLMHLGTLEAFQTLENGSDLNEKGVTEVNEFTNRFGQILAAVRLD